MIDKLEAIHARFLDVEEKLSDPSILLDMKVYSALNKEYKELQVVEEYYQQYNHLTESINSSKSMLKDEDEEMRELAQLEMASLHEERDRLEEKIKTLLIPKDPDDDRDVIFEIRSGTGGDEASIFAGDLFRMYSKYFEKHGWKMDVIDVNEGTVGGFNKLILEVKGEMVYGNLKFESGAHRVQRVPKTESQGRVHTSAATVAVIPKFEIEDIDIKKDDLRTDTFRASGAGGQHINKTESGVRFTHIPTGIVSESTDSRSQHKNREIALTRLYAKIRAVQEAKIRNEQKEQRKSLVGSGDRSDKIRTYNYPQNRVTDHRINLTLYHLENVMQGELDEIINALQIAERTEIMKGGEAP